LNKSWRNTLPAELMRRLNWCFIVRWGKGSYCRKVVRRRYS